MSLGTGSRWSRRENYQVGFIQHEGDQLMLTDKFLRRLCEDMGTPTNRLAIFDPADKEGTRACGACHCQISTDLHVRCFSAPIMSRVCLSIEGGVRGVQRGYCGKKAGDRVKS